MRNRAFSDPEDLQHAYQTWQSAMDSDESELSEDDKALAKRWVDVASKAQMGGPKELGECEAYFEIRIIK